MSLDKWNQHDFNQVTGRETLAQICFRRAVMNVEQFQNLIIGSGVVREELVSVHFSCKQRTDTNCRFRVVFRGFFRGPGWFSV